LEKEEVAERDCCKEKREEVGAVFENSEEEKDKPRLKWLIYVCCCSVSGKWASASVSSRDIET
jgi:hypothetical protein